MVADFGLANVFVIEYTRLQLRSALAHSVSAALHPEDAQTARILMITG
jgi:hypothetical protein